VFDEDEVFQRVSSFYQEKDGKYQKKSGEIMVRCINQVKEEKVSDVSFNLAMYIGRGAVKDSIQLTGGAYFLDYEIEVSKIEGAPNARASMTAGASTAAHENSDEEEEGSSQSSGSKRTSSVVVNQSLDTTADTTMGSQQLT
jgi:hypothetical protein